jgi:site-specific recombinase XerC
VGKESRFEPDNVRYSFHEKDESDVDLSADQEHTAVQLLLGHSKLESTVRYLGIDIDDALEISEQIDV